MFTEKAKNCWQRLKSHQAVLKEKSLKSLFDENSDRAKDFSIYEESFLFDFSKNYITRETVELFKEFAENLELKERIQDLFSGKKINFTEDRPALHTALRDFSDKPIFLNGTNIKEEIAYVRKRIFEFSEDIFRGRVTGFSGKKFKNIVNIGIGGSDLGPKMVCEALKAYKRKEISAYFLSNIDPAAVKNILDEVNIEETLFIVVSKSFSTQETLVNANLIKDKVIDFYGVEQSLQKHFVAVSSNVEKVKEFGVKEENVFPMWDWVGGRFSLSSAVGLVCLILIGKRNFEDFLKGLSDLDEHFNNNQFLNNVPIVMAFLSFWYGSFFNYETQCILFYSEYLNFFPAYLQQLEMESNGKGVDVEGNFVNYQTGQIIWGGTGTNCQHAFMQLLHQGTKKVPVDFVGFINSVKEYKESRDILMSHFFAQQNVLAFGNNSDEGESYKALKGGKPSNTLIFDELNPRNLGKLISLYEHKTFVLGVLWKINSFDQWGVELGKTISTIILEKMKNENLDTVNFDSSTELQMNYYRNFAKNA